MYHSLVKKLIYQMNKVTSEKERTTRARSPTQHSHTHVAWTPTKNSEQAEKEEESIN